MLVIEQQLPAIDQLLLLLGLRRRRKHRIIFLLGRAGSRRPQPQASSTLAALTFNRGRPRSPQGPDGSRARRNRTRALRQPSPPPPPRDPQALTGSPGTTRRSSALRRRTVHAGSALRRRSGWRRAGLRTSSETRGPSAITRT